MTSPVKLAFDRYSPPSGARESSVPVIFLHGMTAMKENWEDLPKITAEITNSTVYAVDARNHGDSPWDDVVNFDVNVDDLLHFMDEHNIPKAALVGHSMGGVTAYKTALKAPERVDRVFVEDMTTNLLPKPLFDIISSYVKLSKFVISEIPAELELREAKKFYLKTMYDKMPLEIKPKKMAHSADEVVSLKRGKDGKWTAKANLDAILKGTTNSGDITTPLEGRYEGPTMVVYGKLAPFQVGNDEEAILQHFPKALLVGIEEATHTVHYDCPKEFRKALFDFLNE